MKVTRSLIFVFILLLLISCGDTFEDIGGGYKVDYTSRGGPDKAIIDSTNTIKIYGPILEYQYDTRFIVAVERPRDSIPECSGGPGGNLRDCDEAFEKSTFNQYWIIDKLNRKVYGPVQLGDYRAKREELEVPEVLKLRLE